MKLSVSQRGVRVARRLRQGIEGSLLKQIGQYAIKATKGRVVFQDINGPRGGVDKECRISLNFVSKGTVSVVGRAENFAHAFVSASEKLKSVVRREVCKRVRKKRRGPELAFGGALS